MSAARPTFPRRDSAARRSTPDHARRPWPPPGSSEPGSGRSPARSARNDCRDSYRSSSSNLVKNRTRERSRLARGPTEKTRCDKTTRFASPRESRARSRILNRLLLREADDLAAVLRRRFVREDLVVSEVVAGHAVVIALQRVEDLQISRVTQVADQGDDPDVDHVIAEAASVGPSAGDEEFARRQSEELARQSERVARGAALENVAAKDAQTREAHVIRIVRVASPVASKANRIGREIDLDQVRDEDRRDVAAIRVGRRRQTVRLQNEQVDERRQLRIHGVFAEERPVNARQRGVIPVFVVERDQSLAEERVALAGHLRKVGAADRVENAAATAIALDGRRLAAGRRENADGLLIAAEFSQRNSQRHQMHIESALSVFARRGAQLEQVEYRLDIAVEAVIALPGEGRVPVGEREDA